MTPIGANVATQTAIGQGATSGAQLGPAEQQIAQQIAAGMLPRPTDPEGWEDLIKEFTAGPAPDVAAGTPTATSLATPKQSAQQPTATQATPSVGSSQMPQSSGPLATGENAFVQQMRPWAEWASSQTGLDPNLILAQWGNETGWGTSYQWQHNFNPAGIGITSDSVQGQGFGSIQGGVQAYVNFLKQNPRYQAVMSAQGAQAQAIALGNSGWAAGMYNSGGGPGSSLIGIMGSLPGGQAAMAQPAQEQIVPAASNTGGAGAVSLARSQLGVPYAWGGESAGKDFDCSGLVQWAYGQSGVQLPRVAQDQYNATQKVPAGQPLQPGDLVFFGSSTASISHVGIYIGNGQMIDAPHTGAAVRVEAYNWPDYVGATRPADPSGVSTAPPARQPAVQQATGNYYQILSELQNAVNNMQMQGAR